MQTEQKTVVKCKGQIYSKRRNRTKKDLKSIGLNKYLFPLFRIITVRTNYLPTAENIYLIIILWLNKNSCYCQADRLLPFIEYSAGYIGEKQDGGSSTEDWWRSENKVKAYKRCPYGKSAINASTAEEMPSTQHYSNTIAILVRTKTR